MAVFELIKGDITTLKTDAIVNAANSTLLGGGGVDGAIHRAAGPGLLDECRTLGGCPTGQAKLTSGYNLLAKWVVHTVGPVWNSGNSHEDKFLASCYLNCLSIAEKFKMQSIAFPSISTGVYGFPKERAAKIAIKTVKDFVETDAHYLQQIIFVVFDEENNALYTKLMKQ